MSCFRRLSSRHSYPRNREAKDVYVLKLKEGKYYVGESVDVRYRMWLHVNLNGSAWTRRYGVVKRVPTITPKMNAFWELTETLEQMKLHGFDNVRGSMFSSIRLTQDQRRSAATLYCEKENLCRECGSHTHFENKCKGNLKTSWLRDFLGSDATPPTDQLKTGPPVRECVVCDSILSPNSPLNYCGDFCRSRHSV